MALYESFMFNETRLASILESICNERGYMVDWWNLVTSKAFYLHCWSLFCYTGSSFQITHVAFTLQYFAFCLLTHLPITSKSG